MDTPYLVGGGLFALTMIISLAFLHGEGLWGNSLTLFNLTLAITIAVNAFEPAANQLQNLIGGPDFMDFLGIWLVFLLAFVVLRLTTDALSRMKIRFNKNVENIGTFVAAGLVGCLMYSFACFTLHVGPLQPQLPTMRTFEGVLYSFLRYESAGALSSLLPDREFDREASPDAPETTIFGRYLARREAYAKAQ